MTQHGYLLLADISGYTAYVAGTELEHAQEILTELLEIIVGHFKTLLTISKLEGDAVFAYVSETKLARGDTLLDLIDSTYVAFRDRREAAHRRTTCTCQACRAIPTLDLKFFAHHGDYFIQDVAGTKELVGSDVNLIHRLLKNHVAEATGWKAYALFTEAGLAHMGLRPDGMHTQPEAYEHLGEVQTHSLNLLPRYQEMVAARRVTVPPDTAHTYFQWEIAAPPPVVWAWLNEPALRNQWETNLEAVPILRPGGRNGMGARNHCVHGKDLQFVETVLDWRPFDYVTVERDTRRGPAFTIMYRLESTSDGARTLLHNTARLRLPLALPDPVLKMLARLMVKIFRVKEIHDNLPRTIAQRRE